MRKNYKKIAVYFSVIILFMGIGLLGYNLFAKDNSIKVNCPPASSGNTVNNVDYDDDYSMRDMYDGFSRMSRYMDRMMNGFFDDGFTRGRQSRSSFGSGLGFSPEFDIKQKGDYLIITCDLPGMEKDKIDISIKDNILTISGLRNQVEEKEEENENGRYLYRSMKNFGKFSKSMSLPEGIDESDINAEYKNGVLTIKIKYLQAKKNKGTKIVVK